MVEQLSLTRLLFLYDDSHYVRRRRDALIAEIDLRLAAMMRHMHVHGEQDFAPRQPAVRGIVHPAELLFGQVGNYL